MCYKKQKDEFTQHISMAVKRQSVERHIQNVE
jgi:hypothetical protein